MKTLSPKLRNKSSILLGLLGDSFPKEVYSYLQPEELKKLLNEIDSIGSVTKEDENKVLSLFGKYFKKESGIKKTENTDFAREILSEIEKIVKDSKKEESAIDYLKKIKKEELSKFVLGESTRIIALVLSYADPDESSLLFEELSEEKREKVVEIIHGFDLNSTEDIDDLERFVKFKKRVIETENNPIIKNGNGRKVADLLTRVSPNVSGELISKIREKNPKFAENISEHYFNMNDLLSIGRNSLTEFLSSIHPIVIGCAFRGIENSVREKLFFSMEGWLKKKIECEMDSMGPISLAEIEEAQKGISDVLRKSALSGKIKLWKVK